MAALRASPFDQFLMPLFRLRAAINLTVATAVVLAYDNALTLSDEVTLVWPSRWSLTKVLYFYNRYSPYVDITLSLQMLLGSHSYETCKPSYMVIAYLTIVGATVSETILMIRTYALWNCDKRILWCFLLMMMTVFPAIIIITNFFFRTLNYQPSPIPKLLSCYATFQGNTIWIEFLLFSTTETVLIILTFVKGYDHLKHVRTRLVYTLYEDGLLYYLCFLAISIANVLMLLLAPVELKNALVSPLRVLHSVLSTRVILHIRACVHDRQTKYKRYLEAGARACGSTSPCTCICTCTPQDGRTGDNRDSDNTSSEPGATLTSSAANCPECICNCGREMEDDRDVWKQDWRWWRTWDAEPMSIAEFTFTHQLVAELGENGNGGEGRKSGGAGSIGDGRRRGASAEDRERGQAEGWSGNSPNLRDEDGDNIGSSWVEWILRCTSWISSRWTRTFDSRVRGRERQQRESQSRSREHSLVSPTSPTSAMRFTYPRRAGKGILSHYSSSRSLRVPETPSLRYISTNYTGTAIYDDEEYKQEIEMEELPSPVSIAGSGSALVPKKTEKRKIGDG